jgi:hypothetical protein
MGLEMLNDVKIEQGKGYGEIYAPKRGVTLSCELVLISEDELQVNVSYRGFTRKQTWTRTTL